jgi:hypothetical protein
MSVPPNDTELLRRADAVFDALLDLPQDERASAVQRLSDEPALHALLLKMLDAHSRAGVLDSSPLAVAAMPREVGQWSNRLACFGARWRRRDKRHSAAQQVP